MRFPTWPWAKKATTEDVLRELYYGSEVKSGVTVTSQTALEVTTVFRCVCVISDCLATIPLRMFRKDPASGRRAPAEDHPLYEIFDVAPNDFQDSLQYRETLAIHLALVGNAYSFINRVRGQVRELIPIDPRKVRVKQNSDFSLAYEVCTSDGAYQEFPQEAIWHLRGPTWNGYTGLETVKQGKEAVGLSLALERSHARLHKNGVRSSGVYSVEGSLNDAQYKRLREYLTAELAGLDNNGKPVILDRAAKFLNTAITGVDSQHLECCVAGTLVSMADGTRKPVEELSVRDMVIGWDTATDRPVAAAVSAVGRPPVKPVVRITTARGRILTTTDDHPYLALRSLRTHWGRKPSGAPSWIKAKDLSAGCYVRIGLGAPPSKVLAEVTADEAWFLGFMVGDGYIRNGGCSLSATEPAVIAKAGSVVQSLGGTITQSVFRPCDWVINSGGTHSKIGAVRALFRRADLEGCGASTKRVPQLIMRSGPAVWSAFLSGYLDADGTVTRAGAKTPHLSWSSINRELLDDCRHLLAMLGIQSAIYLASPAERRTVMGQDCDAQAVWALCIYGVSQIKAAADILAPAHAEKRARLLAFRNVEASRYRQENFDFDRVINVEFLGDGETIGIEIEGVHTHVTNGIVTHNTRNHQIEEICRLFGVLPIMVGYSDKTATYASAEQMFLAHAVHTARPWHRRFEASISKSLLTKRDRENGIYPKFIDAELLRGAAKDRAQYYQMGISAGWLTRNEAREWEELNPIDGLSEPLAPLNMTIGNPPEPGEPGTEEPGTDVSDNPKGE